MSRLAGRRVLLIGDSHSLGPAGSAFVAQLQSAGAVVTRAGRVGRAAVDLVGRESEVLTSSFAAHPDLVVYWLGTNDGPTLATQRAFVALQTSARDAGAKEVWAVGPPAFASDALAADGSSLVDRAAKNATTMRAVFGDTFVDSRPLTEDATRPPARESDLIHFKATAGKAWGDAAATVVIGGVGSHAWLLLAILTGLAFAGIAWAASRSVQ